jgi:hypothetical protein
MAEMDEAEKAWPQSSSVIASTFRVETPGTHGSSPRAGCHLGERGDQHLLDAKRPSRCCRTQLELPHARDEGAGAIAGAVAETSEGALALLGRDRSVISASSISGNTARTIPRSPSGLLAKSLLTATIADLASLLVLAAFSKENQVAGTSPIAMTAPRPSAIPQEPSTRYSIIRPTRNIIQLSQPVDRFQVAIGRLMTVDFLSLR